MNKHIVSQIILRPNSMVAFTCESKTHLIRKSKALTAYAKISDRGYCIVLGNDFYSINSTILGCIKIETLIKMINGEKECLI